MSRGVVTWKRGAACSPAEWETGFARYPAIMRVLEVGVAEEERSTRYRGIERPKNAYAWLTRESSYEEGLDVDVNRLGSFRGNMAR